MTKRFFTILFFLLINLLSFWFSARNANANTVPCEEIEGCDVIDALGCESPCVSVPLKHPFCKCVSPSPSPPKRTCDPPNVCFDNKCGSGYTYTDEGKCSQKDVVCCKPVQGDDGSGGGGSGGTGNPSELLVNLDALIEGMGSTKLSQFKTLGDIVSAALPLLYGISGFALFLFLIFAGFKYLTSSGDPKKLESAKGALTAAIIGFILIFVAYWLTQAVNYIFNLKAGF